MLGQYNMPELANWMMDQTNIFDRLSSRDDTLRDLLLAQRLRRQGGGPLTERDCFGIRSALEMIDDATIDHDSLHQTLWLCKQTRASDGSFSNDRDQARKAFQRFSRWDHAIERSMLSDSLTRQLIIVTALAGHQDNALLRLVRGKRVFAEETMIQFLRGEDLLTVSPPQRANGLTPLLPSDTRSAQPLATRSPSQNQSTELDHSSPANSTSYGEQLRRIREAFFICIAANRFDLADRIEQRYRAAIPVSMRLDGAVDVPSLPPLQQADIDSTIRHFVAADILGNQEVIRSLFVSAKAADLILKDHARLFSPVEWAGEFYFFRNRTLANFIASKAHIEVDRACPTIVSVRVSWPWSDTYMPQRIWPTATSPVHQERGGSDSAWLPSLTATEMINVGDTVSYTGFLNTDSRWLITPSTFLEGAGNILRRRAETGDLETTREALEILMQALIVRASWGQGFRVPLATRAWTTRDLRSPLSFAKRDPIRSRIEWTTRLLAAEHESPTMATALLVGNGNEIDLDRDPSVLDQFPVSIIHEVEEILLKAYEEQGRYDQVVAVANHRAKASTNLADTTDLLRRVYLAVSMQPQQPLHTNWRTTLRQFVRANNRAEVHHLINLYQLLIAKRYAQAIELAESGKKKYPFLSAWITEPTNLIWLSLRHQTDTRHLKMLVDRYQQQLLQSQTISGRHTLACAKLALGETDEAIEMFAEQAADQPYEQESVLFYGMVAENLGLGELAKDTYQTAIKATPDNRATTVARRRLHQLQQR